MNTEKKRQVVVLTRNYSTGLSVVRSLGFAGYPVDIVASGKKPGKSAVVAESRFVGQAAEVITEKVKDVNDNELIDRLLEYRGKYEEKPVLFPADDYTASVMDYNRSQLEDIFLMPFIAGGTDGTLAQLMNKITQCRMAAEVGFPVAKGWEISLRELPVEIPSDMVYPCFCKPAESITGYKLEMKRCDSESELREHLNLLHDNFSARDILVQEFLEIDREIELDGLCFDDEIIVPAVSYNSWVAEHEKGVPIAGKLVPFEELGETKQRVIDVLRAFRYTGMFDMGILQVGDQIYFNEINLRSGGPNYVYYESGVNLPELFVRRLTGGTCTEAETQVDTYGKTFVYEEVAWNEIFAGLMTEEDYNRLIETSDVRFMYNEEDPVPWNIFWEGIEKTKNLRAARTECIQTAMEATGWDEEYARNQIERSRELLNISYREYRKCSLWKYPLEEQEEEYRNILERREKRRIQREECIRAAMDENGWDAEYAREQIEAGKRLLDISYREYRKCSLWEYSLETVEEEYRKILEKREKRRIQREECIAAAVEDTGWDAEYAKEQIEAGKKLLGISYREYRKSSLWKYPLEEQEEEYRKILEKREKRRIRKENCITSAMAEAGWDRETAEAKIEDARKRLGITYREYQEYHFCIIPESKQEKKYLKLQKKNNK